MNKLQAVNDFLLIEPCEEKESIIYQENKNNYKFKVISSIDETYKDKIILVYSPSIIKVDKFYFIKEDSILAVCND